MIYRVQVIPSHTNYRKLFSTMSYYFCLLQLLQIQSHEIFPLDMSWIIFRYFSYARRRNNREIVMSLQVRRSCSRRACALGVKDVEIQRSRLGRAIVTRRASIDSLVEYYSLLGNNYYYKAYKKTTFAHSTCTTPTTTVVRQIDTALEATIVYTHHILKNNNRQSKPIQICTSNSTVATI